MPHEGPPEEAPVVLIVRLERGGAAAEPFTDRVAHSLAVGVERGLRPVDGEIRAPPGAPWEAVAAAYERLRAEGIPPYRIDFYGTRIPTKELRARAMLPPLPPIDIRELAVRPKITIYALEDEELLEEAEPELPEDANDAR